MLVVLFMLQHSSFLQNPLYAAWAYSYTPRRVFQRLPYHMPHTFQVLFLPYAFAKVYQVKPQCICVLGAAFNLPATSVPVVYLASPLFAYVVPVHLHGGNLPAYLAYGGIHAGSFQLREKFLDLPFPVQAVFSLASFMLHTRMILCAKKEETFRKLWKCATDYRAILYYNIF